MLITRPGLLPVKQSRSLLAHYSVSIITLIIALILAFYPYQRATGFLATPRHSSSTIAITPDGATILVVNPDSNTTSLVDTATQNLIAEIYVGIDPRSVAVAPDGLTAFVVNQGSDTLVSINISSASLTAMQTVGDRPAGVAVSPDGRFLAISEFGLDRVRFLDARSLQSLSMIPVEDRPHGLAFTPDGGHLVVTHLLSGQATVLIVQPYIYYLPLISLGLELAAENTLFERGEKQEAPNPSQMIATWPNVAPAPAAVINVAGDRAYLPQSMANGLGYNTQFDTTIFPKVSVLNLETYTHQTSEHISLPETDRPVGLPWDVALAKNDEELWVVNSASNDVSVINISSPTHPSRIANLVVGDNPRGIVISPDGNTAYIHNALGGTISVIDALTYSVTAAIPATTIPLPPALLHGKRLYHSSADPQLAQARWVSCNTCHIEGEHDGRTWLLQYLGDVPPGEQPVIRRNTTSLLGMIETYPLRWSAEWDESADSEFSIRFEQFGTGLINGSMNPTLGLPNQGRSYDLDCLASYIDSLTAREREYTLAEVEQRGKALFESTQTQCSACHPAPLYTDMKLHDVGTADGDGEWFGPSIDTPTLRFLYDSAPYLHDGSALTLWDVLTTKNVNDRHGVTSNLTDQQLEDLVSFLLAIPYLEAP